MIVPLSEVRPQIRTGDMILFRGYPGSLFSWLIKLKSSAPHSHVGCIYWDRTDGYESLDFLDSFEGSGCRQVPFERIVKEYGGADWYSLDEANFDGSRIDRHAVARFFLDRRGDRYASVLQLFRSFTILGHFIRRLFELPTKRDDSRAFCSQQMALALRHGGVNDNELGNPDETYPGQLALLSCVRYRGRIIP